MPLRLNTADPVRLVFEMFNVKSATASKSSASASPVPPAPFTVTVSSMSSSRAAAPLSEAVTVTEASAPSARVFWLAGVSLSVSTLRFTAGKESLS